MSDHVPYSAYVQAMENLNIAGYLTPKGLYYHMHDLEKADLVFSGPTTCIFGIEGLVAMDGDAIQQDEGLPQEAVVSFDLGWNIGDSTKRFEAALLANGILLRFLHGQKVVRLQSLAPFALFSSDQTEALLATIPIIYDHEGEAYSPLRKHTLFYYDLVEYINNVMARALTAENVPEEYKLMCKDTEGGNTILFDKRWIASTLHFYRFLTSCSTTQYNAERDDFAINGLIMVTDDCKSGAAREKKSWCLEQEKENPLSEIHTYKSETRQQVRIKWHAFRDLFLKKYMNGRLAKLWRDTMVHGGEMLSAGHPTVLKIFAARQVEHQTATPNERRMLQEQVDTANETAETNGVADAIEAAAPVYSAEEMAVYDRLERERIASAERIARLQMEEERRFALETERMKIREQTYLALQKERIRSSESIKLAADRIQADKEAKMLSDKTYLEQFRAEREREAAEKLKRELNSAFLTIRMKDGKIEHLEKRLETKDEQLVTKDQQIVKKDEHISDLRKQLQRSRKRIYALTTEDE